MWLLNHFILREYTFYTSRITCLFKQQTAPNMISGLNFLSNYVLLHTNNFFPVPYFKVFKLLGRGIYNLYHLQQLTQLKKLVTLT